LYHLALQVEQEVQGRRQEQQSFRSNTERSFQQRSDVEKPKAPVAKLPATPVHTPTPAPASEVSKLSNVQSQAPKKNVAQGSSSSNIVCHRCKGMGHIMKDCPSRRAFIAAPDGNGYVSASDVEDNLALAANIIADSEDNQSEAIVPSLRRRVFLAFLCSVC
jgi:hypothetical protein